MGLIRIITAQITVNWLHSHSDKRNVDSLMKCGRNDNFATLLEVFNSTEVIILVAPDPESRCCQTLMIVHSFSSRPTDPKFLTGWA